MTKSEAVDILLKKSNNQLVEIIVGDKKTIYELRATIKKLEDQYMKEIEDCKNQLDKTSKISEYWEKKERPLRRNDIDNDSIIERYVSGDSAYQISKDTGIGQMTIISRLKRANVYEGKHHKSGGTL